MNQETTMKTTPPRKVKRVPGLDALRGIAILGVIGYHLAPGVFPGGYLGVNLFFVLSGFLMAFTSRSAQTQGGFHVMTFYRRRASRIYPALILCVCGVLCAARLLTPDVLPGIRAEVVSILTGSNNWWQISQNASYFTKITGASPFTHLWSLAVEMQFYLVWPLLLWLYDHMERRSQAGSFTWFFLIIASILSLFLNVEPGEGASRAYYGTDTRFFALLLGGLVGLRTSSDRAASPLRTGLYIAAVPLLLAIQLAMYFLVSKQRFDTYWLFLAPNALLGAALVALCADRRFSLGKLLELPPLSWTGKRSYELYLVQYPVIFFVQRAQPFESQSANGILALLLILLIGNWMYWVISEARTKIKSRRNSPHEKTRQMLRQERFVPAGSRYDDWWGAGAPHRAEPERQRGSAATSAGAAGQRGYALGRGRAG